ncbi:unnamed protein product [Absidia cylindrospora]
MLIRTNSILKLDFLFTETTAHDNISVADDVNFNIFKTIIAMADNYDWIQRYINNNIKANNKNDSQPATILAPDQQGSSFICCIDQDEDGEEEEDETQIQPTSCSESITSKTTITTCLGIHQYAPTNCNDAAYALIEHRVSQQDDDNDNEGEEEQDDHDWIRQDAADSDAADNADQGSFVSFMNLNQQQQHHTDDDDDDDDDSIILSKQQQEEEWFKGTVFYNDPGTPPLLPPKDYISFHNFVDFEEHKKIYDQDIQSMYQSSSSPSMYSLAFSTKIGTSIKSRRRSITGKFRNALKRKSIFSRA